MSKRMIDASVWRSENFSTLPPMARLLMMGLITTADDQGRLLANPKFMRGDFFACDEDVKTQDVQDWLDLLHNNKTINLYSADGKQYAQLVNWWKYQSLQYAMPSKFPKPEYWTDRIRYTFTKGMILTYNWSLGDGTASANTCDESGTPLRKSEPNQPKAGGHSGENTLGKPEYPPIIQVDIQVNDHLNNQVNVQEEEEEEEYRGIAGACAGEYTKCPPPLAAPPIFDPPSKQQERIAAAEKLSPTVSPNRVVTTDGKPPIIMPVSAWKALLDVLINGLGLKAIVEAGVKEPKIAASFTLETLFRMSPRFQTESGIQEIFESWHSNDWRGKSLPTAKQVEEHASKMVSGRVVCELKEPTVKPKPEPQIVADPIYPDMLKPQPSYFSTIVRPQ